TLRQAIIEANANPGPDFIEFAISGAGTHTINLLSPLPAITSPLTIFGYSQGDASANTNPTTLGLNAVIRIVLDGSTAGVGANGPAGVILQGGATGNIIGGSADSARNVISGNNGGGVSNTGSSSTNNQVMGNFIGTDVTGTGGLGNTGGGGVGIDDGATNNTVG